ncbi:hypothetical protein ASG43_20625 [Aureimonas sp. Leaf454]|uniref:beta strand repeat-containing protein n=1 Tax=Aureimonas sp. Leaf454 TaxID=1736381 RepID=UPI0007163CB0|nr:hypothetical protein [Aureimonas sp. Leaf454]KQT51987.1 hypothetical protein ASG43_20625 [Aureimonas sp. Leaf454]
MSNLQFNETFYLSTYPDVAAAVSRGIFASGQAHYNANGRFEGRNPNQFFNTAEYLGRYPDVARAGVNPLDHFLRSGAAEGRFANSNEDGVIDLNNNDIADDFNAAAYLAQYPDVAAQTGAGRPFATAYQHFVQFGQFEGRTATLSNGTTVTGPFVNGGNGASTPNAGQTLTLTTNVDNVSGTANNDTIVAAQSETATSNTFQSGDVVNGGGGTDTLRIVASNTTAQTVIPTLTSVENIEYQGFGAAANTLNLATSTGVQNVALVNGTSNLTVTNVASLIGVGASNATNGNLVVTYNTATVAGTADVQAVTLNNSTGTTIRTNGVETINLAVTGTNGISSGARTFNDNAVASTTVTTVNVSGTGSVVLGNTFANTTTTFNASANTGGVFATFADGGNVTATGGSGNDTFNFGAGLTATAGAVLGDVVNGGTGTDTVRVTTAGDLSAATAAAPFSTLTSIERVAFDGTGVTLSGATFTNAGVTNIELNTVGNDTINGAGSARTYEFGAANTGDAAFNLTAGSTTLNLALLGTVREVGVNGVASTAEVGALAITPAGVPSATNVTAINLASLGNFTAGTLADAGGAVGLTAGTFNSTGVITAANGSTLTVTGNAALDIAGSTNNITVNASALTGSLVVEGSAFTGTAGAVGGAVTTLTQTGVDTISLGSARDVVQFLADGSSSGIIQTVGTAGAATANGNVFVDVINGFTAGATGDRLDIAGVAATYTALAAATQTAINGLSGANATLLSAANAAADGNAATGWTAFSFQNQTYALYEANADAAGGFVNADTLVQLTGVTVSTLTADNFA